MSNKKQKSKEKQKKPLTPKEIKREKDQARRSWKEFNYAVDNELLKP